MEQKINIIEYLSKIFSRWQCSLNVNKGDRIIIMTPGGGYENSCSRKSADIIYIPNYMSKNVTEGKYLI